MFAGAAGVSMTILSTSYGLSLGLELQSAILILTAFNLTNGTGRLLFGFISDRFNRNRLMSATFLVAGIAYLLMPGARSLAQFAVLAGAIGLAFGTMFAVSAPLVLECYGVRHFGSIFGLAFAAYGFVAGPLGPALSGYILDITGDNYMIVFCYLAAFYFLSAICILQVVPPK
jgi:OFA family oxalate/formate antiporter-like MFS transporter